MHLLHADTLHASTPAGPMLLERGAKAFERILQRIEMARRQITLRCFNWRADSTGELVAEAVIRAADRGVKIIVHKDQAGAVYEYSEASRQSFLHRPLEHSMRWRAMFLMAAYRRWGSLEQRPCPAVAKMLEHPNIEVHRHRRLYDHAKVWVFDEEAVILGGMGIGDDDRFDTVDFMVEVGGADAVRRYKDRYAGLAEFDPGRALDYLMGRRLPRPSDCGLISQRLALIASARERLSVEMAYLGDRRFTAAMQSAILRGVYVTLITSEQSNVLGHLNHATCDALLRTAGARGNLRIALHPRMVHSKVMVIDRQVVELGSANFTPISHGVYGETDVYLRDGAFAAEVESVLERHVSEGRVMTRRVPFNRVKAGIERVIVEHYVRRESH